MRSDRENGGQYLRIIEGKLLSQSQTSFLGLNHDRNANHFPSVWRISSLEAQSYCVHPSGIFSKLEKACT